MKELFASAEAGLAGLLFFFVFFCGVTLWAYRPSARKTYDKYAHIPLEEKD